MKTETEIKNKVQELDKEIENWTKERWKKNQDHGYIDYCIEIISNLSGEKNSLNWVLQ